MINCVLNRKWQVITLQFLWMINSTIRFSVTNHCRNMGDAVSMIQLVILISKEIFMEKSLHTFVKISKPCCGLFWKKQY